MKHVRICDLTNDVTATGGERDYSNQVGTVVDWNHPRTKARLEFAPMVTGSPTRWKKQFTPVLMPDGKVQLFAKGKYYSA